ncbi:MAG: hypothetical protein QXP36_12400 [Conexivisphaerales archaeon]
MIKAEELLSVRYGGKYKKKRIESAERSIGNPLAIGFEYYIFASIGLIIEVAVAMLILLRSFFVYAIVPILIGLFLGIVYERASA